MRQAKARSSLATCLLCIAIFLLALSESALSETRAPGPAKHENKSVAETKAGAPAETGPESKSETDAKDAAPPEAEAWTKAEIDAASARCDEILKRIEIVAEPEPPMRKGECGAPAPLRLTSVGKSPAVAISPPAVVTCELAEAIHNWVENDLQPLARKHLGTEIVKIENISDYSCRYAPGRAKTRLSEHGRANALDIRRFVTAKGQTADLVDDWGITQRELEEIAAAKAAAEKAAAERAAADAAAQKALQAQKSKEPAAGSERKDGEKSKSPANPPPAAAGSNVGMPASGIARGTIVDGVPKLKVTLPGGNKAAGRELASAPNRLAGPKMNTASREADDPLPVPKPPAPQTGEQKFLHEAHAAACRIFGTVLGPEANAAHRNHFHVDMAERAYRNYCE